MSDDFLFEIPFEIELDRPFGAEPEQVLNTKICSNDYVQACFIAAETIRQILQRIHEVYDDVEYANFTIRSSLLGFEKEFCFAGNYFDFIPRVANYEFSKAMNGHFGVQVNQHAYTH